MRTASALPLLALVGCGASTPPAQAPQKCPPQEVTISILAGPTINPTAQGETRPVIVRVYQLKGDARLYNATFEKMWNADKDALADDLFKVEEVQVYPATRVDVKFDRAPDVQHVAAVALFQQPRGRSWVSSVDLPQVPEAGKCGPQTCEGEDDDCEPGKTMAPRLSFWIDGSKVDDGVEHLDDFPKVGPMKKKAR